MGITDFPTWQDLQINKSNNNYNAKSLLNDLVNGVYRRIYATNITSVLCFFEGWFEIDFSSPNLSRDALPVIAYGKGILNNTVVIKYGIWKGILNNSMFMPNIDVTDDIQKQPFKSNRLTVSHSSIVNNECDWYLNFDYILTTDMTINWGWYQTVEDNAQTKKSLSLTAGQNQYLITHDSNFDPEFEIRIYDDIVPISYEYVSYIVVSKMPNQ